MNNSFHMFILRGGKGKGFHVYWEKRINGSSHVRIKDDLISVSKFGLSV